MSGFVRGDDTQLVRLARKLSEVEPQVQKRNFPSVKQIQDRLGWGATGPAIVKSCVGFSHGKILNLFDYFFQNL